jgi:hypothetical protein
MSHDYSTAWDALTDAIGAAKGQSASSFTDQEHLKVARSKDGAQMRRLGKGMISSGIISLVCLKGASA